MTTYLRRFIGVLLLTLALAALAAGTAAADDAPVVPILNGGQLHWTGTATRTYTGSSVSDTYIDSTDDAHATITWDTRYLLAGHHADDPVTPTGNDADGPGIVYAQSFNAVLGTGSEHTTATCEEPQAGEDCQYTLDQAGESDQTCNWKERSGGAAAFVADDAGLQYAVEAWGIGASGNTKVNGTSDYSCATADNLYDPTLFANCSTITANDAYLCGTIFSFPDPAAGGDGGPITQSFDHTTSSAYCGRSDDHESCQQTGHSTLTASCALCVTDIRYQQPDLPGRGWTDVAGPGTFDGNTVRITATIHNATDQSITAPVRFRDLTTKRDLPAAAGGEQPAAQVAFPAKADTTVTLDWDTEGFAWYAPHTADPHKIAVLTPYGAARRDLPVRPKPVMLVHGFNADSSTWNGYASNFTGVRDDWLVWTADGMNTDPVHGNTLFTNGQILGRDIEKLREEFDAEHVDLVVHSMGGLISRSYLNYQAPDDPDHRPVVDHLVMLGTPNEGSNCADRIAGVAWGASFLSGHGSGAKTFGTGEGAPSFELMPEYLQNVFNVRVTDTKGTKFSVLAGLAPPKWQETMHVLCNLQKPNDLVVWKTSAFWTIADTATQDGLMHTDMTHDATAFQTFVAPRLEVTPEGAASRAAAPRTAGARVARAASVAGARSAAAPKAPSSTTGDPGMSLVASSVVPGHATRRVPIQVPSGSKLAVLLLGASGVDATLVDPQHKTAATAPASAGDVGSIMAATTRHGRWTLVLHNTGTTTADVALGAVIDGDSYRVVPKLRAAGKQLALTVSVAGAGGRPTAKAYAKALDGSGTAETVTLRRHGSTFTGTVKPFAAGTAVLVNVKGRNGTRTATLALPPGTAPASLK